MNATTALIKMTKNKLYMFSISIQLLGILAAVTFAYSSGNIQFAVVAFLFCLSYAISFIAIIKKFKIPICNESCNSINNAAMSKSDDLEKQTYSLVLERLQIIPVLNQQLQSVITHTDDAAGGIIEAFMGISRLAKRQLKTVQEIFGNISEKTSDNNILSQTQENLKKIETNFLTLASYFENSLKMISDFTEQLSKVDNFADDIIKIGKTTNILALNASIEASHSGAGLGFKVIASEIKDLSQQSSNSIKEITEITGNLKSMVHAIKQELCTIQQQSINIASSTDDIFKQTTSKINVTLQETVEKIKGIAGEAELLSKEISKAVVSIQFQDITRQKIEHVISPLELLNKELTETINRSLNNKDNCSSVFIDKTEIADALMKQYTMESEREVLRKFSS